MGWIIEALKLDTERQSAGFTQQWRVAEVRIISVADEDVGWLQAAPAPDAIFLGQLYLARRLQRQGIGSRVMQNLIEEATLARKAITLAMVKTIPRVGSMSGWDSTPRTRISTRSTCGASSMRWQDDRRSSDHTFYPIVTGYDRGFPQSKAR